MRLSKVVTKFGPTRVEVRFYRPAMRGRHALVGNIETTRAELALDLTNELQALRARVVFKPRDRS